MKVVDLRVPSQGDGVESCLLAVWLADVGEQVTEGKPVFEVETDKATFAVDSPASGRLVERRAEAGDEVLVGSVVGLVEVP